MPNPILLLLGALATGYAVRRSGDPKRVFFSFHYDDIWKVNQVKKSWVTRPGLRAAGFFDASLEEVAKTHADDEIEAMIDEALEGTEVTVVLFGGRTHSRRWVHHEIEQSLLRGNGILAVDISRLRNPQGRSGRQGRNPLSHIELDEESSATLDVYVPEYDWVRDDGYSNLREWVREAPTLSDIEREHRDLWG